MKRLSIFIITALLTIAYSLKAQTWDERPVYPMKTVYEQDFTTGQWDGSIFYDQWYAHEPNIFTASDITKGYLQFEWIGKRILRSKEEYISPYIFEAEIAYGENSNYGGLVIRAVGNGSGEAVQEPADSQGGDGYNSEGIAFYPTGNGDSLVVQFTGAYMQYNTPVTRIKVPQPDGITSFEEKNTFRIEDFDTSIYVFINDDPFLRIELADKSGLNYTSGSVYNSSMEEVGSFAGMEVKVRGELAICQRVASLRLYSAKIQVANIEKQSISFDPIGVKTIDDQPFKISAVASSGLPLSLSLVSGPAELVNDTVKLTGKVGVVNILVSQEGNNEYHPVAVNLTFYVSKPGSLSSGVPVTGLLICCRGSDRGPFLINEQWNASHDYSDINQVRSILTHVQNAGINVVNIDMTNPSQWTKFWDIYSPMCENIRTVCAEKNMEYFVMIGAVVSDDVRAGSGMPEWIKTIGHLEFWNMQAQYIWENWAQDSHYRRYGYGDDRKIINMFYPGILVESLWNGTPDAHKTYLSKFYRGTHEYNQDYMDTPTDGWGYRDIQQSSDGKIRFVSPTSGLHPSTSTRISAEQWADRIDWAGDAAHYSIYGSYDDNNDNIHWGINDTKNATSSIPLKYPDDDPYYYYDVLKNKLTSSPDLSFIAPLDNDTFELQASIEVEVNATDEDSLSHVKLYINETLVGQDSVAPYQWGQGDSLLTNLGEGYYTLKAVASDTSGITARKSIRILVGEPYKHPVVSFIKPSDKDTLISPANLEVEVEATDNGRITNVELYINYGFVRQDTLAPYQWGLSDEKLTNLAAGNYILKAVATDNIGNRSEAKITAIVKSAVGISEKSAPLDKNLITIYPNPAKDVLNFQFTDAGPGNTEFKNAEVKIYNITGERVISQPISGSQASMNIKPLPAGLYLIKITHKDRTQVNRFIKN